MEDKETPNAPTKEDQQLAEFARAFAKKYGVVLDEPIPERLVDLIQRLKEVRSE